jgi:hypothetical protein
MVRDSSSSRRRNPTPSRVCGLVFMASFLFPFERFHLFDHGSPTTSCRHRS